MQGYQITAYIGAEWPDNAKRPVRADSIVKSWEPTRDQAEAEKRRLERERGGIVIIES